MPYLCVKRNPIPVARVVNIFRMKVTYIFMGLVWFVALIIRMILMICGGIKAQKLFPEHCCLSRKFNPS